MLKGVLVPIHREGWRFAAAFAAVDLLLWWLWQPLGWIGLAATAWCVYFFRDPPRVTPVRSGLVVSPADGVVQMIQPAVPPTELGLPARPAARVSVFMNVFDVHVNRSPVDARIAHISYVPGAFLNAELDKASEDNERQAFSLELTDGRKLGVVQIAGLVARRIIRFVEPGDWVQAGQRIGLIRFGSRVDVYLPPNCYAIVSVGQRAIAGETVLADLGSDEQGRAGRRS